MIAGKAGDGVLFTGEELVLPEREKPIALSELEVSISELEKIMEKFR